MTAVAQVPYIQRRGNRFNFRRACPRHLVHRLRRREVKVALGTVDLSVARRRARTLANAFEEAMEMVETNPQLKIAEIDDLVRRYMAREWARAERDVLSPDLDHERELESANIGIDEITGMIYGQRFEDRYVRQTLKDSIADSLPPDGTPEHRHAANVYLRANLESLRLRVAMMTGEYAKPSDPMFADLRPDREEGPTLTLTEALEGWQAERKPSPSSVTEGKRAVRRFVELHGDLDVTQIIKPLVRDFKDALIRMPTTFPKALQGKTMPEILELTKGQDVPRASTANINKGIGAIQWLLGWCVDNGYLEINVAHGMKIKGKAAYVQGLPFSVDEANRIFATPVYTEGERPKGGAGEFAYWAHMLGMYTGARLGELGQLRVCDVRCEAGIHYLDINTETEDKSVKTPGSRRKIPLHSVLIAQGFLDYVETRKKDGPEAPLWPDLKPDSQGNICGNWSKWHGRYRPKHTGIKGKGKNFHSWRHTFIDRCRAAGINREVHDAITGHSDGSVSSDYGNGVPLEVLAEAMAKIEYPGLKLPSKWSG